MMLHSASALCLLLVAVSSNLSITIKKEKRPPQTLARGWGDDITWVQTYEEGLFHIQKSNKPLMVIHHLEDCQYCQALKKVFAQNKEIQEMAQNNFIMLNLMHETTDKNLSPDGQYVPRIMFVDPSLTVRADIMGRYSNRLYTYEPQDLPILIENMKKALKLIQSEL
ncbi:anterior gradient protein 3 [Rhinolophus sinicus]|uniref:anterior gradient protein 3 n=1 Tax=Rhinolophus sinicus TaxID=89399 RepID=UPI00094331D2|nr:PREDICTED: anterior gradient protein 3 [Rhinolophus sinicus]